MSKRTMGDIVDELHACREEIKVLNSELKAFTSKKRVIEQEFIEACKAQDLTQVRGALATASYGTSEVPHVINWDKFYEYILQNEAFELLEKRAAVIAWRETVGLREGKPIPGVEKFEKEVVHLHSI